METLKNIGTILGSLTTILVFLATIIKPFRKWIVKIVLAKQKAERDALVLNEILEAINELKKQAENQKEQNELQKEAQQCVLRNAITIIYYTYKKYKAFPEFIRENLITLNTAYVKLNGNHYVKAIYDEMYNTWETED